MSPPKIDIWFIVVLVAAILVPSFYEDAHIKTCDGRGTAAFFTIWSFITGDPVKVYTCTPMK